MTIRLLSEKAINKIAAGEVIERPISVIKELVENSIDANANEIEVSFIRGGRTLIAVTDNGSGISRDQLKLAIERHTTSKIKEDDINKIMFYGFRGEALASIASVGLMSITTKTADASHAWQIKASSSSSAEYQIELAKHGNGTTVALRDIFCFTPNRVKFLRSESAEIAACVDLIKKFALCFPNIAFKLVIDGKIAVHSIPEDSEVEFFNRILGGSFFENSVKIDYEKSYLRIHGLAGLPTFNHPASSKQYCFVNKRVIKDRVLAHAIKYAYSDLVPHGRFPAVILLLELPYQNVDVNVHPTKSEVRFVDEQFVRRAVIEAIRNSLCSIQNRQSTSINDAAIGYMNEHRLQQGAHLKEDDVYQQYHAGKKLMNQKTSEAYNDQEEKLEKIECAASKVVQEVMVHDEECESEVQHPFGSAIHQIDNTYIVSVCSDSLIVVDQHAAHERIVLEKIKASIGNIAVQRLLIPVVLSYDRAFVDLLVAQKNNINKLGIDFVRHGISEIAIMGIPVVLKTDYIAVVLDQILRHIHDFDDAGDINQLLTEIYGNIACKNSIKAGRSLSIAEMNALLREMEKTKFIEQCNHGRPTYVRISSKQLEKLFER